MLALLYSFSLLATQTVESACMLRRARLIRSDRPSRHLSIRISRNRVSICLKCSLYVRMALPRPVIRLLPFLSYRHLLSFFLGPPLPPLLLDALPLRSRTPPAVKTLASNFEHHPVWRAPFRVACLVPSLRLSPLPSRPTAAGVSHECQTGTENPPGSVEIGGCG